MDKDEDLCLMLVVFRPSEDTPDTDMTNRAQNPLLINKIHQIKLYCAKDVLKKLQKGCRVLWATTHLDLF